MPPPDPARIEELLTAARAAHLRYQLASARMEAQGGQVVFVPADPVAALAALREANDARRQADTLDHFQTTPAWARDAQTHPHQELLAFYAEKLSAS